MFYLFLFWALLSGKVDFFHIAMGLLSAAAVAYLSLSYDPGPSELTRVTAIPGIAFRAARYMLWLLIRIISAVLHVSGLVLSRRMPVEPEIIKHQTILKTDLEKVIFAHSITLTPGTITADIRDDTFTVHRLDRASSADIESRVMEKEIQKIFHPGRRGS